jgi:hypothetical protein
MRVLERSKRIIILAVIVMGLSAPAGHARTEPYTLAYHVIGEAERILKQAAYSSPNWHRKQDAIERDVYDITFYLDQAWKARERANEAAMKDNAYQALLLLQRAIRRGHFDGTQVEPVLRLIRHLLPNVSV